MAPQTVVILRNVFELVYDVQSQYNKEKTCDSKRAITDLSVCACACIVCVCATYTKGNTPAKENSLCYIPVKNQYVKQRA